MIASIPARPAKKTVAISNPFVDVMIIATEMSVAAAHTIGHRLNLMSHAGFEPNAAERREFVRMGAEKVTAFTKSAQAMSGEWTAMQKHLTALMEHQWNMLTAAMTLNSARTLTEFVAAQEEYWQTVQQGTEASLTTWTLLAQTTHKGLLPLHAKATANARRLTAAAGRRR